MLTEHSPLRAIRAKCLDCCGDSSNEVKLCTCTNCALYPFRLGKNPYLKKGKASEEMRQKYIASLKKGNPKIGGIKSE